MPKPRYILNTGSKSPINHRKQNYIQTPFTKIRLVREHMSFVNALMAPNATEQYESADMSVQASIEEINQINIVTQKEIQNSVDIMLRKLPEFLQINQTVVDSFARMGPLTL